MNINDLLENLVLYRRGAPPTKVQTGKYYILFYERTGRTTTTPIVMAGPFVSVERAEEFFTRDEFLDAAEDWNRVYGTKRADRGIVAQWTGIEWEEELQLFADYDGI